MILNGPDNRMALTLTSFLLSEGSYVMIRTFGYGA